MKVESREKKTKQTNKQTGSVPPISSFYTSITRNDISELFSFLKLGPTLSVHSLVP